MLTTGRVRKCSGMSTEREQYLPLDLLLEIVARSDVTTVVRCTIACRTLRRAILDPAIRCRFAADGGGLDPALLVAVSYRALNVLSKNHTYRVIHTPSSTQPRIRLDASSMRDWFEPVASRDGLFLVRLYNVHVHLRVCDAFTGRGTSLPPLDLSRPYAHVFLSVGDTGSSYEVLVADTAMRFQTFSSKHGQWTAVRQVSITEHDINKYRLAATCLAVIGGTIYWPCCRCESWVCWDWILAMDVDTAFETIIELPPGRVMARRRDTHHLLVSVCGFLSLLVLEIGRISIWTLTSAPRSKATWSRQMVIDKVEFEKVVGAVDYTLMDFVLEGFGERSGAVIVRVGSGDLLRLDLGTKTVKRLNNQEDAHVNYLILHGTDLVSLLQAMKYF